MKTTFMANAANIERKWYVVDAAGQTVGRLAAEVAKVLRGKNKPTFAPHADGGNFVIVINADKISLSGNKLNKNLYSHSGYPSGLRADSYAELLEKDPERIIRAAVKGMMPKNKLAKVQLGRLRVYAGDQHPHTPNQPQVVEVAQVSQQAN